MSEPTTSLVQSVKGILTSKKPSVGALFGVYRQPEAPSEADRAKVVIPAKVTPTSEQEKALQELPELLAGFTFPTTRRKLNPAERRAAVDLLPAMRHIESLVKAVRESLRTTVLNHGDVVLEDEKRVNDETPREKDGHYLVPDTDDFVIGGVPVSINRSVTSPKVALSVVALESAVKEAPEGELFPAEGITRKEYLAVTKTVRVNDEAALFAYLVKHPERTEAFMKVAELSGGSLSMLEDKNAS